MTHLNVSAPGADWRGGRTTQRNAATGLIAMHPTCKPFESESKYVLSFECSRQVTADSSGAIKADGRAGTHQIAPCSALLLVVDDLT